MKNPRGLCAVGIGPARRKFVGTFVFGKARVKTNISPTILNKECMTVRGGPADFSAYRLAKGQR